MSSLSLPPVANQLNHSLVHWMVLSGVAIDVGNEPASYQIPPLPEMPDNSSTAKPTVSTTSKPVSSAPSVAINIDKFNTFEELNNFYSTWKALGLAKMASRAVLPKGCTTSPKIMIISDLPDDIEDRHGEAFSSPANAMIRQAVKAAGLNEQDILYSYLSKWRTPAKRPLTAAEKDICMQLLSQEVALANPDMILALGESTMRAICPDSPSGPIKNLLTLVYKNQQVNKSFTVYASPKSEFLLKNAAMKKSFWFSLLDLANRIGA